jgi:hypothetical protein
MVFLFVTKIVLCKKIYHYYNSVYGIFPLIPAEWAHKKEKLKTANTDLTGLRGFERMVRYEFS